MVVGAVAGLVAVGFTRSLALTEDLSNAVPIPEALKAGVGGLGVGIIGVWVPEALGVGYGSIGTMLAGQLPALTLGVLLAAKLAATSLTIGSGGSGGIFAPSLFLGAALGGRSASR
jgi:CIC family chloride channel protein